MLPVVLAVHVCSVPLTLFFFSTGAPRDLHSFPTRRSSDLHQRHLDPGRVQHPQAAVADVRVREHHGLHRCSSPTRGRSEEHTSELQSLRHLVCRLLLEKKKTTSQEKCTTSHG